MGKNGFLHASFLTITFLVCFSLAAETAEGVFPEELGDAATPVWRMALGGAVTGIPTVQAGTLVVVLDGGHIRAYTLDGKALWDYYAKGKLAPYVSRSREGTCYIYRTDGTLIAVNRAGRELWQLKPERSAAGAEGPELAAPIISGWDGRIFVSLGRNLYCYTAAGYRLWRVEFAHRPILGPLPDKSGGLVAALENGDLVKISHFGSVSTRALDEIPAVLAPAKGGVLTFWKNGRMAFFQNAGFVTGQAGAGRKNLPNLGGTPVGGIALENHAAAVLSGGKVVFVSLNDGKVLWTGESHIKSGDISSVPEMLYDERGLYILTREGATGFTSDGRRLWTLRIRGAASVPAFSGEGTLYSGGSDWILYAYKLEERVLRERNSLYGPLPEGSYGMGSPPPSPWAGYDYNYGEDVLRERFAEITENIHAGNTGGDEAAYTAYLMEAAGSSMSPAASPVRPLVQVQYRAEAARLLGYIGSRETIVFLSGLFAKDPDSTVKAAAAEAIGRIGVDPDGVALRAFAGAAIHIREEQVLTAAAAAIGSLCRFSGPPLSESGIRLLNILGGDAMPGRTQAQARRELDGLR
jgi:outer membrane protein assembly factor BamB